MSQQAPSGPLPSPASVPVQGDESSGGGCRGCLIGLGGCLSVVVILLLVIVLMGGSTVNNFINTITTGINDIFNPRTQIISTTVILERVQALAEIRTTRYTFSNIVISEVEMPGVLGALYGDRLVIQAVGYVEAGIDLSELNEEDVRLANGVLTVHLPAPRLQACFLDESKIRIISRDTGVFSNQNANLDLASRQYAIARFRDGALDEGILDEAKRQSSGSIKEFLDLFVLLSDDINAVEIVIDEPDVNAPLPESCQ